MSGAPLLEVADLRVQIGRTAAARTIVDGVSLEIGRGEAVGLVGESGSGKSMTARSILQLLPRNATTTGSIRFAGNEVLAMSSAELRAYRGRQVAMIFQDARAHINPVRTIGDFLTETMRKLERMPTAAARARAIELLDAVGIQDGARRLSQYPHQLSGGMLQRVMIASALASEPQLLLADEPTTALDVTTQAEVMGILERLRRERGVALLFITHDLELAAATCDRTAVMYAGRLVEVQRSETLHAQPLHPYTRGLLDARPHIDQTAPRLPVIPGRPIAAFEAAPGCAYAPRCAAAEPACLDAVPSLEAIGTRLVACSRARDLVHAASCTPGDEA